MHILQAKECQYDSLFDSMMKYTSTYLQDVMNTLGVTVEEFKELFRKRGKVYVVYLQEQVVGFFWTEKRDETLHIHALIVEDEFQGRGFGRKILQEIEGQYSEGAKVLEIGVHLSNDRARKLYEDFGFVKVKELNDIGFMIMQKDLTN
ncbi:MAG: GNAT family N-acetyltransferase [Pseudothermotoga sp.]